MRRGLRTLAVTTTATALVLAGCGGDDGDDGGSATPGGDHDHAESSPAAPGARRIHVTGTSFAFDPPVIRVTAGEDVAIVLTSGDLLHDVTVDELDVHVAADGGETAEGGLRGEEPGRYVFYCSVPGHRQAGMEGTLVVETG